MGVVKLPYQDLGAAGRAWVAECLYPKAPWAIARWVLDDGRLATGSVLGLGVPAGTGLPVYPLVAYILWATTRDEIDGAFGRHEVGALGDRVLAVVNTVFDADGYSIWLPDQVRAALLEPGAERS